jgi:hypothetical protein
MVLSGRISLANERRTVTLVGGTANTFKALLNARPLASEIFFGHDIS